jgi:hypothetical protein
MTPSRKPGVAFWATVVVVVVLLAYPISFGPACWLVEGNQAGERMVPRLYYPILWIALMDRTESEWIATSLHRYAKVFRRDYAFPFLSYTGELDWRVNLDPTEF